MDRGTTRRVIHTILRKIGTNGFDGLRANSRSASDAFNELELFEYDIPQTRRHQLIAELKRQELIEISRDDDTTRIALSIKGIYRLQQAETEALSIESQSPWDQQWRMVMFDIPARHSDSRYILTSSLKRLGFTMIQGSAWVHPFPCSNIIEALVTYANIQPHVCIAQVKQFDSSTERKLRHHFRALINPDISE